MKDFFHSLADEIGALIHPGEQFLAYLEAENSDLSGSTGTACARPDRYVRLS